MSKNILELLVDCIWNCGVSGGKMISKALGISWTEHDFKKFFNAVGLKNIDGEYPKLQRDMTEGVYRIYIFDIPLGLTLDDFNKSIKQLSIFMKTSEECISFYLMEDFSGVRLKVLRLEEFFRQIELKNNDNIHPKLKSSYEEELSDVYVFDMPRGMTIGDFRKNLMKIADYFKLDINKLQFVLKEAEDINNVELRIFR